MSRRRLTLAHKVETEIFRAPTPQGAVSINARTASLFLRGAIDDPQWISRPRRGGRARPRRDRGHNLLHTPDMPSPPDRRTASRPE
jgi:hypothetical protein